MLLPVVTLPDKHLQSEGSAVFESSLCTSEVKAQLSVELQTWAKVAFFFKKYVTTYPPDSRIFCSLMCYTGYTTSITNNSNATFVWSLPKWSSVCLRSLISVRSSGAQDSATDWQLRAETASSSVATALFQCGRRKLVGISCHQWCQGIMWISEACLLPVGQKWSNLVKKEVLP